MQNAHEKLIEHYGLIHHLVYQKAFEFLKLHRPDWIFIFNGRFYREKAIWKAAQDLGIKVKFIERFSPTWEDRYFEFERPVHSIEYRCSTMRNYWTEFSSSKSESEAKDISEKWFVDRSQGVSQAFTREQNLDFKRNPEIKTLVTFSTRPRMNYSQQILVLLLGMTRLDFSGNFKRSFLIMITCTYLLEFIRT